MILLIYNYFFFIFIILLIIISLVSIYFLKKREPICEKLRNIMSKKRKVKNLSAIKQNNIFNNFFKNNIKIKEITPEILEGFIDYIEGNIQSKSISKFVSLVTDNKCKNLYDGIRQIYKVLGKEFKMENIILFKRIIPQIRENGFIKKHVLDFYFNDNNNNNKKLKGSDLKQLGILGSLLDDHFIKERNKESDIMADTYLAIERKNLRGLSYINDEYICECLTYFSLDYFIEELLKFASKNNKNIFYYIREYVKRKNIQLTKEEMNKINPEINAEKFLKVFNKVSSEELINNPDINFVCDENFVRFMLGEITELYKPKNLDCLTYTYFRDEFGLPQLKKKENFGLYKSEVEERKKLMKKYLEKKTKQIFNLHYSEIKYLLSLINEYNLEKACDYIQLFYTLKLNIFNQIMIILRENNMKITRNIYNTFFIGNYEESKDFFDKETLKKKLKYNSNFYNEELIDYLLGLSDTFVISLDLKDAFTFFEVTRIIGEPIQFHKYKEIHYYYYLIKEVLGVNVYFDLEENSFSFTEEDKNKIKATKDQNAINFLSSLKKIN